MLDVHAEDLSFVTLWPESEDGYAAWLAPKDEYRRLFRLLSRPGCLELLEHLHCYKRGYFVVQAVAKQLDMPGETVEELLKALEERQILRSVELELESGEARAYELAEPAAFVPPALHCPVLHAVRLPGRTGGNAAVPNRETAVRAYDCLVAYLAGTFRALDECHINQAPVCINVQKRV